MSDNGKRYGIALLSSGVSLAVVLALATILPFEPFLLFAIPVALTSRYAGRGPTVLAVLLSFLGIEVTLFVMTGELRHDAKPWLHAAVFAAVAFAIDSTTEALRRARRDAEHTAAHLEEMNVELEQQMEQVQMLSEELHESNRSLAAARDAAEGASRDREEMLAIVAHDLRNPLNVVMMTTQLFTEIEPTGEKREQLLAVMRRAAKRMNRLIEDLLDVVRQESGHLALDIGEVPVAFLISQTTEMFQTAATERGVALCVLEPPPGLTVRGDAERIMQVMGNIVGNGLKFVPRGGSVAVDCKRKEAEAVFAVADTGPGISGDDLDRLFEKFWQRRRTDRSGVGLGLAISRGIVEAHGGRIWAESAVGSGTTFYFTLPVAKEELAMPYPAETDGSMNVERAQISL